ncbi:Protein arginine N-methyltransferase [Entamoeba marina]
MSLGVDVSIEDAEIIDVAGVVLELLDTYSYVTLPLSQPYDSTVPYCPVLCDTDIDSNTLSTRIYGKLTPYQVEIPYQFYISELNWANHIHPHSIVIPSAPFSIDYLRYISTVLLHSEQLVYLIIDLNSTTWNDWNCIRNSIGYNSKLVPILRLTNNNELLEDINIWTSENVASIIIPKEILDNDWKLSRFNEILVAKFLKNNSSILLENYYCSVNDLSRVASYCMWIYQGCIYSINNNIEMADQPFIQQSLYNWNSIEYENEEKDNIKYQKYLRALEIVLSNQSDKFNNNTLLNPYHIYVLGAGRGSIIILLLNIIQRYRIKAKITAVEWNLNSLATLRRRQQEIDWKFVKVTNSIGNEKNADLVVCNLLGNFGDNEMFPEYMNGFIENVLKENGVIVPSRHSSYLQPISDTPMHLNLIDTKFIYHPFSCNVFNYVPLDSSQMCFDYTYPSTLITNKEITLTFTSKLDGVCHGLLGSVRISLCDNVVISTVPNETTPGITSLHPLIFPINPPIVVKKNQNLVIKMWRCSYHNKLWYEWIVIEPMVSKVFNCGGEYSYEIIH